MVVLSPQRMGEDGSLVCMLPGHKVRETGSL